MIVATTCIPIIDIFSDIPSTFVDQLLWESLQDDWSIFLPKMTNKFLSWRFSHTKPLRDLVLNSKHQTILREHPHLESKQTTKAFIVSLTNHSRRVSCISSHSNPLKSHKASWKKKLYVESAKATEMDEFSTWKLSRTKGEKQ